jgi:D-sedoheptulose 7-phosphate isomerase
MDPQSYVRNYLAETSSLVTGLDVEAIATAIAWIREAATAGRTIYACGNGGSAQIGSHMVSELVKHASMHSRFRFKAVSLADSIGTILSYANDVNFESIFVEPLKNFTQPGDVLVAISGSGQSENVLRAVQYARQIGCKTIGMTTSTGGRLKDMVELVLGVPGSHMGHLEDCFFAMAHMLCYAFIDKAV